MHFGGLTCYTIISDVSLHVLSIHVWQEWYDTQFEALRGRLLSASGPLSRESGVRKALIAGICSGIAIASALTGCVRDLHGLRDLDERDTFEQSVFTRPYNIVSLRHGSSFPAVNGALLELLGLAGSRKRRSRNLVKAHGSVIPQRDTCVSVTFISPTELLGIHPSISRPWWLYGICKAITLSEMMSIIGLAIIMGIYDMICGSMLRGCMFINTVIMLVVQHKCEPVFANSRNLCSDKEKTAAAGAALDAHLVCSSWKSSYMDALCGYSSHLHSFTNIPVRITNTWIVLLCCRILALSLLTQAAILASLVGASDFNALIPLVWLSLYVLMLIPPALMKRKYPSLFLDAQPGVVTPAITVRFSERRAALAFIAMLPVTPNAGKWDFMDGFILRNARREKWQEEIDTLAQLHDNESTSEISEAACRQHCQAVLAYRIAWFKHYL